MTVLDIPPKKFFLIMENEHVSGFLRVDESEHEGNRAYCINSTDPTYDKGVYYPIQTDIEVIPVERK